MNSAASSTRTGYVVTPTALADAARGVDAVLERLRSLGLGVGRAEAGRGVQALALRTGPVGHAGLGEAFGTFCSRWEWGVRALVQGGREMAAGLSAAGAAYAEADQGGMFQRILPGGDATADRSWAEVGRSVAGTWTAVWRDAAENSGPGMVARALNGDVPVQGQLDDVARLSEIAD